jgi:hypothetical protein
MDFQDEKRGSVICRIFVCSHVKICSPSILFCDWLNELIVHILNEKRYFQINVFISLSSCELLFAVVSYKLKDLSLISLSLRFCLFFIHL